MCPVVDMTEFGLAVAPLGGAISSLTNQYFRVSMCPFLALARWLARLDPRFAFAFTCACALDLALGLTRAFSVCVYLQHSLCLLSRVCFLSLSCSFPLVLSRCLSPSRVWISGSDFRDGVRALA